MRQDMREFFSSEKFSLCDPLFYSLFEEWFSKRVYSRTLEQEKS